MSTSKLVDYIMISANKTSPRADKIRKITIHHMAGNLTVEECGQVFKNRAASAHYGIGNDGRIGQYVYESDRSWSTENGNNDHQAINIELANDSIGPEWHVSDLVISRCIELCVDICKRNNIEEIHFTGEPDGNLTLHKWFAATLCPGPYLESKIPYIADEINKALKGSAPAPSPAPAPAPSPAPDRYEIKAFMELCQYGSTGKFVEILQAILQIEVDGSFGPATLEAVKNFQRRNGLEVDGSVGPATWQKLFNVL